EGRLRRRGDGAHAKDGEAAEEVRRGVLHVPDDTGGATDEQPGGAGDPLSGDRPAGDAGDAGRGGPEVERADLDGAGQLRAAGARRVRVPARGGAGVLSGG